MVKRLVWSLIGLLVVVVIIAGVILMFWRPANYAPSVKGPVNGGAVSEAEQQVIVAHFNQEAKVVVTDADRAAIVALFNAQNGFK